LNVIGNFSSNLALTEYVQVKFPYITSIDDVFDKPVLKRKTKHSGLLNSIEKLDFQSNENYNSLYQHNHQ
jgi:hypothetical protein